MPTIGLVAVLGAFLLARQLVVGRGKETPGDIKDMFASLVTGDFDGLGNVLARRSESSAGGLLGSVELPAGVTPGPIELQGPYAGSNALVNEMITLGHVAKGYRLGSTGPDYYDCSGLVWAAMKAQGIFNGPRFTTKNFTSALGNKIQRVTTPSVGDIVLWPNHHMGVMTSSVVCYSALSPSNGITFATVSSITPTVGNTQPVYYRITG